MRYVAARLISLMQSNLIAESTPKTTPVEGKIGRYRPDDQLLAFLKSL